MLKYLCRHVEDLLARQPLSNVAISYVGDRMKAQAIFDPHNHELLDISIPRLRTPLDYAVTLHEFGHVFGCYQDWYSWPTLTRERWAWRWARINARLWTPPMEFEARWALTSRVQRERAAALRWSVPILHE